MKIALVTNFFYPEKLGGTELYCFQLAQSLIKSGHKVYWFVPHFDQPITIVEENKFGLELVKFAAVESGQKPKAAFVAESFLKEMQSRDIHIAHFNEFGGYEGISTNLLKETKNANIRTVITLHLVHYICQAGTMRYGGYEPCDGQVIPNRCGSCVHFSQATDTAKLNLFFTNTFRQVLRLIDRKPFTSIGIIRRKLLNFKGRLSFVQSLKENADVIVSLTEWFRDVLILNGVPVSKIHYLQQVTPFTNTNIVLPGKRTGYVFIGRINKEKGINLLLAAAKQLKEHSPGLFIDVYGPVPERNEYASAFLNSLLTLTNINYKGVLDPAEVLSTINRYKAVLLPSHVAEMAPLIIMEANKLKVPVIASDVPGSRELINRFNSGLVFKYDTVTDLVQKILEIENNIHLFTFKEPFENDYANTAAKYISFYNASV